MQGRDIEKQYGELLEHLRLGDPRAVAARGVATQALDPDVDLIFKSLAYVLNRAEDLVADGKAALRKTIGHHLFPGELTARGSMALLGVQARPDEPLRLPRGTELILQRPNKGIQRFTSLVDTVILPFSVTSVDSNYDADRDRSVLTLSLRSQSEVDLKSVPSLRMLFDGRRKDANQLYRAFRTGISTIEVSLAGQTCILEPSQVRNLFEGNSFVEGAGRTNGELAFDILEHYFTCPESLVNIELKLDQVLDQLDEDAQTVTGLTIRIEFLGHPLEGLAVEPALFVLDPLLVENRCVKSSLPVVLAQGSESVEFRINLVESDSEVPVDIEHIDVVGGPEETPRRFVSHFAGRQKDLAVAGRFQVDHSASTAQTGASTISAVLSEESGGGVAVEQPLVATLQCTNGTFAQGLDRGTLMRLDDSSLGSLQFRSLTPSTRYQPVDNKIEPLVNELLDAYGCSIEVFSDTEKFKSLWSFYATRMSLPSREIRRFEAALLETNLTVGHVIHNLASVPNYAVELRIDDVVFDDSEGIFLYGDVIQMFVVRLCPVNCSSSLSLQQTKNGEVIQWPIMFGSERLNS